LSTSPVQVGEVWIEHTKRFDIPHKAVEIKKDRDGRWFVRFEDSGSLPVYWDAEGVAERYGWTKKG
jgi:hypothetical protein